MLAQAIYRAVREAGLAHRVDFRTGDNAYLPFADASLDLVVSTLSLHHWADPASVLNEVPRVLRPGGAFLIFDLRRDLGPLPWLLLWFVTHVVVPASSPPGRTAGQPERRIHPRRGRRPGPGHPPDGLACSPWCAVVEHRGARTLTALNVDALSVAGVNVGVVPPCPPALCCPQNAAERPERSPAVVRGTQSKDAQRSRPTTAPFDSGPRTTAGLRSGCYSSSDKDLGSRSGLEASAGFSGQRARPAKASSPEDHLDIYSVIFIRSADDSNHLSPHHRRRVSRPVRPAAGLRARRRPSAAPCCSTTTTSSTIHPHRTANGIPNEAEVSAHSSCHGWRASTPAPVRMLEHVSDYVEYPCTPHPMRVGKMI